MLAQTCLRPSKQSPRIKAACWPAAALGACRCLLITARGFPDLATRVLVQNAAEALRVPCLCFTDWNPHGLALMLTYKFGSLNVSNRKILAFTALFTPPFGQLRA